jgi:hypothetical protein
LRANQGSEGGTIVVDEEHEGDASVRLERDTNVAPAALTCGAYVRMQMPTRYFASLDAAWREFEAMKADLGYRFSGTTSARVHRGPGRNLIPDRASWNRRQPAMRRSSEIL